MTMSKGMEVIMDSGCASGSSTNGDGVNGDQTNNNNSLMTNNNITWKQRKRKRLSIVLDKLHNNNNSSNINNNNNDEIDNDQMGQTSTKRKGNENIDDNNIDCHQDDVDDDRSTIASDELLPSIRCADVSSMTVAATDAIAADVGVNVKREQMNSPLCYENGNDENVLLGNERVFKQEDRRSDCNSSIGSSTDKELNLIGEYLPQMQAQKLFEQYLQLKCMPEVLSAARGNMAATHLPRQQLQQQQQQQLPFELECLKYLQEQQQRLNVQKPVTMEPVVRQPQRKRQRTVKPTQVLQPTAPTTNFPIQEAPLDLSMKSLKSPAQTRASPSIPANAPTPPIPVDILATFNMIAQRNQLPNANGIGQVPIIKGDVASPATKESIAFRYNLDVSPVVEEMAPGNDIAYVCPICGQMFSLHDRLAKHMASRHRNKSNSSEATKSYVCEVCDRSFARSDMLTRHMRLHTGIKPYTCKVCNQVFSRSDHLSTHQRTHTGEKPYKCPQCSYAACRRDMITRHMRTHARYEAQRAAAAMAAEVANDGVAGTAATAAAAAATRKTILYSPNFDLAKVKMEARSRQSSPSQLNNNNNDAFGKDMPLSPHILASHADALLSAAGAAMAAIKTEST